MSRIIMSSLDCADCLCRVCARNECNDSWNPLCNYATCTCDCTIGYNKVVETKDDCPNYLEDVR